jgi:hypothetical protein
LRLFAACLVFLALPGLAEELGKAGGDPPKQVAILEALPARLSGADRTTREEAAKTLLTVVADPDRIHLHAAAMAPLVATELPRAVGAVVVRAYDRNATPLRAAARKALAEEGDAAVTAELMRFLALDSSPRARAWLALFLGRRGDPAAGTALVRLLADRSLLVRSAAAEALTRIWRRCHGYDREAWAKAIRVPPKKEPPEDGTPSSDPGATVTEPAPAPDPGAEIGKLVPRFYGVPLDCPLVVVVLDFSGSIRGEGAREVRRRLRSALDLLPTTRRFTVVAFDERLYTFGSPPRAAIPDAKLELAEFLADLPPGRRTELLLPIRSGLAFAAKYGEGGAQVLIVSDGTPTRPGPPLDAVVSEVERNRGKAIRVDAAVYGGRKVGLFGWLTKETGGRVVELPAVTRGPR